MEVMQFIQQHYAWLIGILAALTGVYISLSVTRRRSRKALSYSVLVDTPLVAKRRNSLGDKLKILYEDEQVDNVYLVQVVVRNSGGQPIVVADYEQAITLLFGDNDTIFEAEVSDSYPLEFTPKLSTDKCTIRVAPVLMNPGDQVTIKVLLAKREGTQLLVVARIAGVSTITSQLRITEDSFVEAMRILRRVAPWPFREVFDLWLRIIASPFVRQHTTKSRPR